MLVMEINNVLKNKIAGVARKHGLSCIVLFGSRATGKTHALSDTDIAFMADRDVDYREQFEIQSDFGDALNIGNLELVNMRRVSPLLMRQIADKGKLLYEDRRGRFVGFRILSFKLYVETAPLRRMRENYLTRFIQAHAH
jgi:predicted nucleotidyltransferase